MTLARTLHDDSQRHARQRHAGLAVLAAITLSAMYCGASLLGRTADAGASASPVIFGLLYLCTLSSTLLLMPDTRENTVRIVACVFLFVSGFDLGMTISLINPGLIREANPFPATIIRMFGSVGVAIFKVLMTVVPVAVMLVAPRHRLVSILAITAVLCSGVLTGVWYLVLAMFSV